MAGTFPSPRCAPCSGVLCSITSMRPAIAQYRTEATCAYMMPVLGSHSFPPHPASHPICLGIGHPGAKNFPASVRPGTEDWVGGVIAVRLELDDLLELRVNLGGKEKAYKVSHLPPLELAFRFPPTYPSADPPALALGCPWLTQAQLETVIHLLDAEWDSYVGMSVIFRLVEILKASDTNTDINTSTPPAVAVAAVARPSGWWGRGCIFRAGCSFSPLLCTQPI